MAVSSLLPAQGLGLHDPFSEVVHRQGHHQLDDQRREDEERSQKEREEAILAKIFEDNLGLRQAMDALG